MRKQRIRRTTAQKVWDEIAGNRKLAKFNDAGLSIPPIDMDTIFKGRKTITLDELKQELGRIIAAWTIQPGNRLE